MAYHQQNYMPPQGPPGGYGYGHPQQPQYAPQHPGYGYGQQQPQYAPPTPGYGYGQQPPPPYGAPGYGYGQQQPQYAPQPVYAQQQQQGYAKPHNYDVESGHKTSNPYYSNTYDMGHANLRNSFLRKIYSILCVQLLVTVAACAACSLHVPTQRTLLSSPRLFMWGGMIPSILCMLGLHFYKHSHPLNAILLAAFTLFESLTLGVICAMYSYMGMGEILVQAGGLTLAIFTVLTAYVHISRKDFDFMRGFLMAGMVVMIGWALMSMLFGFRTSFLYSACGALLFCGFILYDTSQILLKYSYDDHIPACISLYLDIINLFLHILRMLASDRRNGN